MRYPNQKLNKLKSILKKYNAAIIAFSGGADSTFLAKVASHTIDNILLVTATSESFPFYELEESKKLASYLKLAHRIIITEEIKIPGYQNNTPDRCYYCKTELFTLINHIAKKEGFDIVFDGSNADDYNDYRPGRKAAGAQGILSPLADAGFTKKEIRKYSKQYNLPTADKPALACLASRIPYGETITKTKLDRISLTEYNIKQLGFTLFRVRSHENLARLEFMSHEVDKAWEMKNRINMICKDSGFHYVSIDLEGYRAGSMNESLQRIPGNSLITENK